MFSFETFLTFSELFPLYSSYFWPLDSKYCHTWVNLSNICPQKHLYHIQVVSILSITLNFLFYCSNKSSSKYLYFSFFISCPNRRRKIFSSYFSINNIANNASLLQANDSLQTDIISLIILFRQHQQTKFILNKIASSIFLQYI